jgi:WD40 repeat protein
MRSRRHALLSLVWAALLLAAVACSETVPGGDGQHGLPSPESQVLEMASPTPTALPPSTSTSGPGPTAGAGPGQDSLPTAIPATTPTPVAATSYVANGNPCVRSFYIIGPAAGGPGQSLLAPEPAAGDPVLYILEDAWSPAFSPDGTALLTGNGQVRLWDAASGAHLQTLGEAPAFGRVAFGPEGTLIAAESSEDEEPWNFELVQLWEANGGRELPPVRAERWIQAYDFSPDGQKVVLVTWVGEGLGFHLVDIGSREVHQMTAAHTESDGSVQGASPAFAFSPDGRLLATADGRIVQLWDTQSGEEVHRLEGRAVATGDGEPAWAEGHASRVFDLTFSPDGQVLLTAGGDWSLRLWDVARGHYLGCFEAPISPGSFYTVNVSPGGRYFAASMLADDYSEHVYMWESASGRLTHEIAGSFTRGASFDPASKRLLTMLESDVLLWDAATGEQVGVLQHPGTVSRATFSGDGAALAVETWIYDKETGDSRSSVWVWNARHPELFGGARE